MVESDAVAVSVYSSDGICRRLEPDRVYLDLIHIILRIDKPSAKKDIRRYDASPFSGVCLATHDQQQAPLPSQHEQAITKRPDPPTQQWWSLFRPQPRPPRRRSPSSSLCLLASFHVFGCERHAADPLLLLEIGSTDTPSPYNGLPVFRPASAPQETFQPPPTVAEAKSNARARFFKAVLVAFLIWITLGYVFSSIGLRLHGRLMPFLLCGS
jgi:hypothetical protein